MICVKDVKCMYVCMYVYIHKSVQKNDKCQKRGKNSNKVIKDFYLKKGRGK